MALNTIAKTAAMRSHQSVRHLRHADHASAATGTMRRGVPPPNTNSAMKPRSMLNACRAVWLTDPEPRNPSRSRHHVASAAGGSSRYTAAHTNTIAPASVSTATRTNAAPTGSGSSARCTAVHSPTTTIRNTIAPGINMDPEKIVATTTSAPAETVQRTVGPSRRIAAATATIAAENANSQVYCFTRALSASSIGLSAVRHAAVVAAQRAAPATRAATKTASVDATRPSRANDCAQAIEPGRKPIHQRTTNVNPGALTPTCATFDNGTRVEIAIQESSNQKSTVPARARERLTTTANAIVSVIATPAHRPFLRAAIATSSAASPPACPRTVRLYP